MDVNSFMVKVVLAVLPKLTIIYVYSLFLTQLLPFYLCKMETIDAIVEQQLKT